MGSGSEEREVASMRRWKMNFVPFWRIGECVVGSNTAADVDADGSGVGWERIVTFGM